MNQWAVLYIDWVAGTGGSSRESSGNSSEMKLEQGPSGELEMLQELEKAWARVTGQGKAPSRGGHVLATVAMDILAW